MIGLLNILESYWCYFTEVFWSLLFLTFQNKWHHYQVKPIDYCTWVLRIFDVVILKCMWWHLIWMSFLLFLCSLRDKSSLKAINVTETSLELPDLDYNVDYSAYVTASTRFGNGKTRSSIINFRTPEGGEFSGISIHLKTT